MYKKNKYSFDQERGIKYFQIFFYSQVKNSGLLDIYANRCYVLAHCGGGDQENHGPFPLSVTSNLMGLVYKSTFDYYHIVSICSSLSISSSSVCFLQSSTLHLMMTMLRMMMPRKTRPLDRRRRVSAEFMSIFYFYLLYI